jgi:hypothetical protein
MGLVGYCRLWFVRQGPIFDLSHKSREMTMNWLFEAYSNVYNTAMFQGSLHHEPWRTLPTKARPNSKK